MRKYVLCFDPKGGDSTLAGSGFQRITEYPLPRAIRKKIEEGKEPVRLIIGPVVRTRADRARSRELQRRYLEACFDQGGWTVYVDELQVLADRRFMALASSIEELLITARDSGLSVVSSFQRPANVPRAATDQASWFFVAYTRDIDVVNRLAEMAGRPKAEMRGAILGIAPAPHTFLVFSSNPREPIIVTRPRKTTRRYVRG